jgi:prepilin-type processing-associated H-X9-DG protein
MRCAVQALALVLAVVVAGGIALVAIARSRAEYARTACQNNLRRFGLALPEYHDVNNHFPPAAFPNPDLPPERRLGWTIDLSAYTEDECAYPIFLRTEKSWDDEENLHAAERCPHELMCPGHPGQPPHGTPQPTSYIGITGIGADAASLPEGDPRAGFFGYERKLTRGDLGERSGQILVLLETAQVDGAWTAAGRPTARGLEPGGSPYIGPGGQFGGIHRGGASALFADGSVRFLQEPVDPTALEAMATLKGATGPRGED